MNLIYTVAFDLPGWRGSRTMTKLLCSSLLRSFWDGQIVVFRNFAEPLFPVERKGLEEVYIETQDFGLGQDAAQACLKNALQMRFRASEWIAHPEQYQWIVYLDADCLALRDISHLFAGEADILVQPEKGRSMYDEAVFNGYLGHAMHCGCQEKVHSATCGAKRAIPKNGWLGRDGINAGTVAIKGEKFAEVCAEWQRIFDSEPSLHRDFRDQTAFNRLLLETDLKVRPFERGEIAFPLHLDKGFLDYSQAALLHFVGGEQKDKINLAFAMHMMRTYNEEGGLFLDLLES